MWKMVNGKLVQTTDQSRVKFRTNISEEVLEKLKVIANENNTHVNYLIETGLKAVLEKDTILFDKNLRPKDRIQFKTTYDKELLEDIKKFAKQNNYFLNDVIEYSVNYIDIDRSKNSSYKHRVE
ncbi:rRNA methyltransferase [Sporosarcina sp. CAU 1771]